MKLLEYEIVFENCDIAKIDPLHVKCTYIHGISSQVFISDNQSVTESEVAKDVTIIISKDANIPHAAFGQNDWKERTVFERINYYDDITHIKMVYGDEVGNDIVSNIKERYISVDWHKDSDYRNKNQETVINKWDDLEIKICRE